METRSRILEFPDSARWRGYRCTGVIARSLGGKLVSHTHQGLYQLSGGTARRCFSQTFLERELIAGSEFDIKGKRRR